MIDFFQTASNMVKSDESVSKEHDKIFFVFKGLIVGPTMWKGVPAQLACQKLRRIIPRIEKIDRNAVIELFYNC